MILVEISVVIKHMPYKPQATTWSMLSYIFQLPGCTPSYSAKMAIFWHLALGLNNMCELHDLLSFVHHTIGQVVHTSMIRGIYYCIVK